ncbi:unnamed protein product [Cyprideis torosa]|uniref:Uncharacterized protein n=1 Tax=Cyprideis torosa TaxID=163714 RepID=A0A7R8W911_9CRUS|nr:unnamed protein product [Cyprideis torosa]CAG0889214.1 unnamed protein product [Cyprideis torosa]
MFVDSFREFILRQTKEDRAAKLGCAFVQVESYGGVLERTVGYQSRPRELRYHPQRGVFLAEASVRMSRSSVLLLLSILSVSSSYDVEVRIPYNCLLGEGPHWSHALNAFVQVDIPGRSLFRYDPETDDYSKASIVNAGNVTFVVPVKYLPGVYLIGADLTVSLVYWDGSDNAELEAVALAQADAETIPGGRLNDGKCDPTGRLYTGTLSPLALNETRPDLFLYRLVPESEHELLRMEVAADNVILSNGMAWSEDLSLMYFADTVFNTVDIFDVDVETGALSNRRTLFNATEAGVAGFVDGMTIDNEGFLWVAMYTGFAVVRIDPTTGDVADRVELPVPNVSSATFGRENLDSMFITTGRLETDLGEYPLAGMTFEVTGLGVTGLRRDSSVVLSSSA